MTVGELRHLLRDYDDDLDVVMRVGMLYCEDTGIATITGLDPTPMREDERATVSMPDRCLLLRVEE